MLFFKTSDKGTAVRAIDLTGASAFDVTLVQLTVV